MFYWIRLKYKHTPDSRCVVCPLLGRSAIKGVEFNACNYSSSGFPTTRSRYPNNLSSTVYRRWICFNHWILNFIKTELPLDLRIGKNQGKSQGISYRVGWSKGWFTPLVAGRGVNIMIKLRPGDCHGLCFNPPTLRKFLYDHRRVSSRRLGRAVNSLRENTPSMNRRVWEQGRRKEGRKIAPIK